MNAVVELTQAQKVVLVDPNELPAFWDKLEPLVEKACSWSRGEFTPEAVVAGILSGAYRLLAYLDRDEPLSIALLTVSRLPAGDVICELLLASGVNLRDWVKFEPQVEEYAKANGCTKFRAIGREGLQRMLPHYRRVAIMLEREFD